MPFRSSETNNLNLPSPFPSPPQTGERAGVRGKNRKGNSYIIKILGSAEKKWKNYLKD
jgi:hypothetical protein